METSIVGPVYVPMFCSSSHSPIGWMLVTPPNEPDLDDYYDEYGSYDRYDETTDEDLLP